jgi:hypothetical protein
MDKPGGLVGELIEKGQKTTSNTVSDIADTFAEQVGVPPKTGSSQNNQLGNQQKASQDQTAVSQSSLQGAEVSEATKEIVEDFYAPSDTSSNSSQNSSEPQTQAKLAKVRQELLQQHKTEYYDPLFAYENKKQEPTKAEAMEQEENRKMQELQINQQKKNEDISITRAQIAIEANRGVAG